MTTPAHEAIDGPHDVLHPRDGWIQRPDVLEEEQAPARTQHAVHFFEGPGLIGHGAQDERGHDRVE